MPAASQGYEFAKDNFESDSQRNEIAGVDYYRLEGFLRAALPEGLSITRRKLFEAGHLAYALASGQRLLASSIQAMFPVHGEPRAVAAELLEDFPETRFILTVREPTTNFASTLQHLRSNGLDLQVDALESVITTFFARKGNRGGLDFTLYGDRPYFAWLVGLDRLRVLKLESLHQSGRELMRSIAGWMSIRYQDCLTESTWQGKRWWNRPESGSDSRLGDFDPDRYISTNLSTDDCKKVKLLAARSIILSNSYENIATYPSPLDNMISLCGLLWPWKSERIERTSNLRCLLGVHSIGAVLPDRLIRRIRFQIRRERYRSKLLGLNKGSATIRAKLPDEAKSATVVATLILSPQGDDWRTRALTSINRTHINGADRISAFFLDETLRAPNLNDLWFWTFVLTVGRCLEPDPKLS
ncbi:hypothetical protein [Sphingobium sp. LB126]|uniref:hypothetical protein n=1 Tax=Sphingobium sp. LB126 TaxID=1983755 RepID=UPI0012FDB99C|nr:hypothetical protein [Sphingobium sp. LB126]